MKKILLAAGLAALISAPAFAAPEPFNVEVGPQGSLRASPPSQPGAQQGAWAQATSQGQGGAAMYQASDEAQPQQGKKKKPRRAKPPQPAE